jgi:hypothetical protein
MDLSLWSVLRFENMHESNNFTQYFDMMQTCFIEQILQFKFLLKKDINLTEL